MTVSNTYIAPMFLLLIPQSCVTLELRGEKEHQFHRAAEKLNAAKLFHGMFNEENLTQQEKLSK